MTTNLAAWERLARVVLGAGLILGGIALFGASAVLGVKFVAAALALLGADFAITGAIGFCPLYARLGLTSAYWTERRGPTMRSS